MDYTNIPLGMRVQSQIPLDVKTYKQSENELKNLGPNNNLAFTYMKGLIVYCIQEETRYEWKEMTPDDIGLLDNNFIYPDNIVTFGIDYSNKEYNFVKVEKSILIDQNNFVRLILLNVDTLPLDFTKTDIISAVLALPIEQRTITETDSLINIAVGYPAEEDLPLLALELYELINHGKGVITSILEDDLQIKMSGLGKVLELGDTVKDKRIRFYSNDQTFLTNISQTGIELVNTNTNNSLRIEDSSEGAVWNSVTPIKYMVMDRDHFYLESTVNGYASNFYLPEPENMLYNGVIIRFPLDLTTGTYRIAMREDIDNNKQKILTYPADFTGTNYTLQDSDHNTLIFINNGATNVTITVSNTVRAKFFAAFIQEGVGDVTFVESSNTIKSGTTGKKILGQNYQVALDKRSTDFTFYLTGNTKI